MNKLLLAAVTLTSLFAGMFLSIPASKAAAAFGVSPPWVRNDHLLPGDTYEETVYLSRRPADSAQKLADLKIIGDEELQKWITVPDAENLILEVGKNTTPMKVVINVPKDAVIKDYKGNIMFHIADAEQASLGGNAVGIGFGGNIIVEISVIEPPKKPSLPGSMTTEPEITEESSTETPPAEEPEVKPAASECPACAECPVCSPCPVCPETTNSCGTSNWVKLILAIAALVGASAGLIFVLRRPKAVTPAQPPQPTASPPAPAP